VTSGDGRVDQIAAKTPKARERPVLVGGEPAVADRNGSALRVMALIGTLRRPFRCQRGDQARVRAEEEIADCRAPAVI
jgi:hypothetical protein